MNKKAEEIGIGVIMTVFITVLVGVVLFQAVAQEAGKGSQTVDYDTNTGSATVVVPADGVTIDLPGQELLNTPVVTNNTDGTTIAAGNYTIDEGVSTTTGVKTIRYTAVGSEFDGLNMNLTYQYGADGYIDSSGGRAIAGLIAIFFALAIGVIALSPTLRSNVLNMR